MRPEALYHLPQGLVRTFQSCKVFPADCFQNVILGAFSVLPKIVPGTRLLPKPEVLEFVGLVHLSDVPAASLTLLDQKQVEVARALATEPKLLMLDEMMAGLNPAEVEEAMTCTENSRSGHHHNHD